MTPLGSRTRRSNGGVGFTVGDSAAGHSRHRYERRGLRRALERRERPLFHRAARQRRRSGKLGPDAAYEYGALIGRELRAQGFNMSLGGGVNLTREPRNGRTFEYLGEDPVLAGTLVGKLIQGTQSQHVIGDIKHYAFNDQESGRNSVNITHRQARRRARAICWPLKSASSRAILPRSCAPTTASTATSPAKTNTCSTMCSRRTGNFPALCSPTGAARTAPRKPPPPDSTTSSRASFFYGDKYKAAVEAGTDPDGRAGRARAPHPALDVCRRRDRLSAPAQRHRSLRRS